MARSIHLIVMLITLLAADAAHADVSQILKHLQNKLANQADRSDFYKIRKQLQEELAEQTDRASAAKVLIAHLDDTDPNVRYVAAALIFEKNLTPPQVIATITRRAEKDADPNVRAWLAAALGVSTSDTTSAIPALVRILHNDTNADTRSNSATALSRIKHQPDTVIPALIKALDDSDPSVRHEAAFALGQFDRVAVDALSNLKKLKDDPESYVTDAARYAIYRIELSDDPVVAVPMLVRAMDDPFFEIRRWSATAAGRFGKDAAPAVPALIKLIESVELEDLTIASAHQPNWVEQVGGSAALALGRIGPVGDVVDALTNALGSRSWLVRREAVRSLRQIGPDAGAAAPDLVMLLDDKSTEVQAWAESALEAIGPGGRTAIPLLIDILHKPEHDRFYSAVSVLGRIGNLGDHAQEGIVLLARVVHTHRDGSIRGTAAYSLKEIAAYHPDACAKPLIELLGKVRFRDRDTIIDALGVVGPPAADATPILLAKLNDRAYSQEHGNIAITIGRIHADPQTVVPELLKRIESANGSLRGKIAFALGMYGSDAKAALPVLHAITLNEEFAYVRRFTREAIRRIDPLDSYLLHE